MSRSPFSAETLARKRLAARGVGRRMHGQCALCHGVEGGVVHQPFPVQKGVVPIAGLKICRTHAAVLEEIAADAGITWRAQPVKTCLL